MKSSSSVGVQLRDFCGEENAVPSTSPPSVFSAAGRGDSEKLKGSASTSSSP